MPNKQNKQDKPLDLLIVGAGPAGISCAIQAQRDGLRMELVSDEPPGGLLTAARRLDNFPSLSSVSGHELAQRLSTQIHELGIKFRQDKVVSMSFEQDTNLFSINTQSNTHLSPKCVCLATGTSPKMLPIPIETGMVHRDIRTLSRDLSSKQVIIIGGGEAALDTALSANDRGAGVSVIARGVELVASEPLQKEIESSGIHVHLGTKVTAAVRDRMHWVLDTNHGTIFSDELTVCIGREPRTELLREFLPGKHDSSIAQKTNPAIFMAGDVIRGRDRYTATAMGDGQRAAVLAGKYIREVAGI